MSQLLFQMAVTKQVISHSSIMDAGQLNVSSAADASGAINKKNQEENFC
jgi:hypothetical protein